MSKSAPPLPVLTPFQFIALLDELCAAGCGKKGEKKGVTFYQITIDNIHEGAAIFKGKGKKPAALLSAAATPSLTPPQVVTMMDEICTVDDGIRRRHQNNEMYMMTTDDIIEGLGRIFRGR